MERGATRECFLLPMIEGAANLPIGYLQALLGGHLDWLTLLRLCHMSGRWLLREEMGI